MVMTRIIQQDMLAVWQTLVKQAISVSYKVGSGFSATLTCLAGHIDCQCCGVLGAELCDVTAVQPGSSNGL